MGTMSLTPRGGLIPGRCEFPTRHRTQSLNAKRKRMTDYTLLDEAGRPVGTIVAPETKPVVGKHAPTFYVLRKPAS